MDTVELYRKLDEVTQQRDQYAARLKESQTALIQSQTTLQILAVECKHIVTDIKSRDGSEQAILAVERILSDIEVPNGLIALRKDAFERGFLEGFIYKSTRGHFFATNQEALDHYGTRVSQLWPHVQSRMSSFSSTRRPGLQVSQYTLDSEAHSELLPDEDGSWVHIDDYKALCWENQVLQEELAGYRQLSQDPFLKNVPIEHAVNTSHLIYPRRPRKANVLKSMYGASNSGSELWVMYGGQIPAGDRAFVMHQFGSKRMMFDYENRRPSFGSSFLEELAARGYDLATFRFSIEKKQP